MGAGELRVILGESGSGKTTTLKMVNRLIEPTSGTILFDGEDTAALDPVALRRRIGCVFQGIGLFPHLTVSENVAVVPRLLKWDEGRIRRRVDELLALLGLVPKEVKDRKPGTLSGGQQQRVGLARALAAYPRILLMDEPFSALDALTRDALQDHFLRLHRSLGLTVLMVSHDVNEAVTMGDRITVMLKGVALATGAPHDLLRVPNHPYVSALLAVPRRQAAFLGQRAWVRRAG